MGVGCPDDERLEELGSDPHPTVEMCHTVSFNMVSATLHESHRNLKKKKYMSLKRWAVRLAHGSSGNRSSVVRGVSLAGGRGADPGEASGQAGCLPHAVEVGGSRPSSGDAWDRGWAVRHLSTQHQHPLTTYLSAHPSPITHHVPLSATGPTSAVSQRYPLLVQVRGPGGALEATSTLNRTPTPHNIPHIQGLLLARSR